MHWEERYINLQRSGAFRLLLWFVYDSTASPCRRRSNHSCCSNHSFLQPTNPPTTNPPTTNPPTTNPSTQQPSNPQPSNPPSYCPNCNNWKIYR
ncbi:hypothetical protein GC097_15790 [Paenibacillus sp. LMG 31457]|uniref:Uncharacterized protein n=1 Tax=Paenibacillus planticolens TaxID=2654976 RepID=A0ABX1ZN08_9BACL|nr:hypothetical protein [Paenibacillus planticolens]